MFTCPLLPLLISTSTSHWPLNMSPLFFFFYKPPSLFCASHILMGAETFTRSTVYLPEATCLKKMIFLLLEAINCLSTVSHLGAEGPVPLLHAGMVWSWADLVQAAMSAVRSQVQGPSLSRRHQFIPVSPPWTLLYNLYFFLSWDYNYIISPFLLFSANPSI